MLRHADKQKKQASSAIAYAVHQKKGASLPSVAPQFKITETAQEFLTSSSDADSTDVLQMKKQTKISIATDLAHIPSVRNSLFDAVTLEAYPGRRRLADGQLESQYDYRDSLMTEDLENDPRISYKPMNSKPFTSENAISFVSHLKKAQSDPEIMFLHKGNLLSTASKSETTDVHPRIFGGLPDVDMAGTISITRLEDIPVGGRNINEMSDKEQRKSLLGFRGGLTFTNKSGHYQFESIPASTKKSLTKIVREGRELTEDVEVSFSEHK